MSSKRLLAIAIMLVMLTSTVLLQTSSLASDDTGDTSVDTQNVIDRDPATTSGEIDQEDVIVASEEDVISELPQEEATNQSTDTLTDSGEPTSEPTETTIEPEVTDNSAAGVFPSDASYTIEVVGSSDAANVQLVARLEVSDENNNWSAVTDPNQSSGDYTIDLTLDDTGSASGRFSLTGLSTQYDYRTRIIDSTLPDTRFDWDSGFSYSDRQIDATNWKTVVQYTLTAPPESGAGENAAVFTDTDFYPVTVNASIVPEAGFSPIQVALYSSVDDGKTTIAQLSITPDDTGVGSDKFALEGLPSDATYTAIPMFYGDEALTFAYDDLSGETIATLGDLVFIQNQSDLGLNITIESFTATEDALSLFGAFDLMRSLSTVTTLTAYDTAYQFTLNLTLNGGGEIAIPATFIVTEHPDTGSYTVMMDSYSASLESATVSIGGTTVTLTLKPITGGELLTFTLTMDVMSLNYSLATSGDSFTTSITGGASGMFTDGEAAASASASEQIGYTFTVLWNDNKAVDRPTPSFIFSANGTALGTQPTPTKTVVSYNEDSYTYSDLPKYENGVPIDYSIFQEALSSYHTNVSGSTVQNTRTQTLSVHLQWNDASTKTETRPSPGDAGFMDHFTLKRKAQRTGAVTEVLSFPSFSLSTSGDQWTFTVPNLVSFDEDGFPYDYMIVQTDFSLTDNPYGTYVTAVKNVGVYNGQTATDTAYNGGTLINTISDKIGFTFHNEWVDNGEVSPRPDVKYYLYRYPTNSSQDYLTLAPVTGHDNMTLTDKSTSVDITYAADDTLPRYDLLGNEYVYYIRVIMPNPGDYQIHIVNLDDALTDFLLPGGTVTYIREATTNVSYTVSWIAKAVQTMKGGVTVQLRSRLSADEASVWTAVDGATQTLTGFRTETMTLTSSFTALPKYDALGARILYRVVETGATIDSTSGVPTDNIAIDGSFTSGEHSFLVTQPAEGDNSNTIYNTIVGATKLTVRKIWNEPLADGIAGSINVRLLRNGSSSWVSDAILLPDGAEALGGNVFGLSGTGNFEKVFSNLSRYDSEGREYTYTVQETAVNAPLDYSLSDIVYSHDAENDPVATIYNTNQSGGSHLVFRVNKIWLDDGDLLQRVPVTFWLYYLDDDAITYSRVDGVSLTLSAADSWTGLLSFSPSGEYTSNYDRYIVREVTNDNLTLAQNGTQAYLLSGAGEAQTLTQKFVVSTEKTGDHIYDITNRRIGKIQITIAKEWAFQAFSSDNPVATFGLYANGALIDGTKTLSMTDPSATIVYGGEDGLEKFDAQGEMIHYTVRELGVTDSLGNTLNLKMDETIVSSVTPGTYTLSSDLSLPDTMAYTFHNSLGGNGSLRVNIIWRDTITNVSSRPDIRLQLYRTTDLDMDAPEYVTTVRLWDTDHEENSWYWTCDFGTYPAFDGAGNRYCYYTKAVALQSSRYSVSYFSEIDGADPEIHSSGTDTQSTFDLGADEAFDTTFAYLNFDETRTGVVILTLSDTQDVVRYKIWRNLPGWFLQSSLPTTYFKLYRTLTPLEELDGTSIVEAVQKDGVNWIAALTNNASTAEFTGVPVYNKFGTRYYYYVEEVNATGALFNVDWYTVSDDKVAGTVTNTYVTGSDEAPVVTVRIDKTWDYSGSTLAPDQTNYPATTYDLHQYWEELDGMHETNLVHDSIVATTTIASGAISTLAGGTISTAITTDSSGNTLPMYTPDGQKFVYYVVERGLTGYTTTYSDALNGRSLAVFAEGETEGVAAITNTYQPVVLTSKIATKVWDDQSNLYDARPLIASADSAIQFTLWQKIQGSAIAINMGLTGVWTQDTGNANQWLCAFSGEFPTYTTLGQSYQYYVTETLSGSYAVNYALSSGSGTLKLTNKLNQVNVQLSKSWRAAPEEGETTGALLDEAELEDLAQIGAMPDSVIFSVLQIKNGTTVSTQEVEVPWSTLLYSALKGKRYVLLSGLPQYFADAASTADVYVYEIQETAMVYDGVEKTVSDAGFTVTAALADGSNTITEITNQIETQKLYFVKDWVDENNRDGVRPSSIELTVTSVESGVSATVTLSPSTMSSDPSEDAGRVATGTGNRWRAEMTVPLASMAAGYTVTENASALATLGYTPTDGDPVTQSDLGDDVNWWGFTNTRPIKIIAMEASKVWAGEYSWSSLTRPASVSLQLQYRSQGTTTWANLGSAIILPQDGQTWANASASWESLPAYAAKTAYDNATTLREYRVVEAATTGYTASYSKALVDGSVAAMPAVQSLTVTNTLKTVSVSGKKTWVDVNNRYDTRPSGITLSLFANAGVLSDSLTPTWVKPVGSNEWTYQYSNLPRYFVGSSTPIVYSVVETPVGADYTPVTATTAYGTVNGTTGVVTAANFTNTLSTVSVSGTKTWLDDSDFYKMRPDGITLTLLADGTALEDAPDPVITKTGNTWSYVFADLPRFVAGTTTPIVYSVEEAAVPGYDTVTGSISLGTVDEATRNVTGANFANALITIDLSGTKTWEDDENLYLTRPNMEEMKLTLYENGVSMTIDSRQPSFVWSETGEDAVWQFSVTGLPKYQKGTNTLAKYTIAETPVVGYAASTTEPITGISDEDGNLSGFDWVNTLQIISISGTKYWSDQENRFQTRPQDVSLTIFADGVEIDPQPEILWQKTGDAWTYTITKLPRYQTGSENQIVYSIRETPSLDYALADSDPVYGDVDSLGNITNADFVNELITVSMSGTKVWDDQGNRFANRPDNITLSLLADGVVLATAPLPTWDKLSDVDAWTYIFEDLPRYRAGTATSVVYTVRETQVVGYAAAEDQSGVVDSAKGNITQVNFTNRLLYELEIDNATINVATGSSDAGGSVAVSGTTNAKRDLDPYKDQAVSVSWVAENFWKEAATFNVSYLPHGADEETGWETVAVTNGDLSALRSISYFANAKLQSVGGVTTLTLADSYLDMPQRARALVTFVPTLEVRNTTDKHFGGTVAIETPNTILDGRYVALIAYGNAENDYAIDLTKLSLIVPAEEDDSSLDGVVGLNAFIRSAHAAGSSTSVRINPNSAGRFSTTLNLNIGGTNRDVTFSGKITVLALDKNQHATKISISMDSLSAPLDIGIPFIRSDSIPATGDPILGIVSVFVISGCMLVLLGQKRRKMLIKSDKTAGTSR